MSSNSGFIKIHRKILSWDHYGDSVTKAVFIHFLLTANYRESVFKNITLKPGQLITSVRKLSEELGQTQKQTRRAIDKLKATNEIAVRTTNRFSVITVVKWAEYQHSDVTGGNQNGTQEGIQTHEKGQTEWQSKGQHIKKINNNKEIKELYNGENYKADQGEKNRCGRYHNVLLTHTEYDDVYSWDNGYTLERFSERMYHHGYKYGDHYQALRRWHDEDKKTASAGNYPEQGRRSYDMSEFERRADELPVYRRGGGPTT